MLTGCIVVLWQNVPHSIKIRLFISPAVSTSYRHEFGVLLFWDTVYRPLRQATDDVTSEWGRNQRGTATTLWPKK